MRRRPVARVATALVALLMLAYAAVRSDVMQAAMAVAAREAPSSAPSEDAMPGMPMADTAVGRAARRRPAPAHGSVQANCMWCSAAAHLPVFGFAEPLRAPNAFSFARWRATSSRGPRGPPQTTPRARGPPEVSLQG